MDTEMVSGVCRFGGVLRLGTVDVPHLVGESLLRGVAAREKECDWSAGEAVAELLSNMAIRSLALVGEAGIDSFSGLDGLEDVERCSSSFAAAATEVTEADSATERGRVGELDEGASADDAALLNIPRMAANELLTDPTCDSGRLAAVL